MTAHSALSSWVVGLISLLALSLSVGCWKDGEEISTVAWSDDDSGQAYLRLAFEESTREGDGFFGSGRRNYRHQVFVQNADGSGRRALTGERDAQHGTTFYYMKQAGYVLVDVRESDTSTRFDLIRTADGRVETVRRHVIPDGPVIPCQGLEVLPSPDGRTLAVIERTAPPVPRCEGGNVIVSFVNATTLVEGPSYQWTLDGMPGSIWTEEGTLIVWSFAGGNWQVKLETGPVPIDNPPSCTWPRTSSSTISGEGQVIVPGDPQDLKVLRLF